MFTPFSRAPRGGAAWFPAGPVSSYPNLTSADGRLAQQHLCQDKYVLGCKVFHVPRDDATQASPIAIDDWKDQPGAGKDQVMVFRFGGRVVGVDHVCHGSFFSSHIAPFYVLSCEVRGRRFVVLTTQRNVLTPPTPSVMGHLLILKTSA